MQTPFDLVVLIPVGPRSDQSFVRDTIDSFTHYTRCSYKIIVADNSQQGIGIAMKNEMPELDIIEIKKPSGSMAGLYVMLAEAFSYALKQYQFKLLLKLDTDALVIGPEPEKEALDLFERRCRMAIAGQYPLDYHGELWDAGWPRARIMNGTMTWKFLKRPFANIRLRTLYMRALRYGYRTGESVFGGAYYVSRQFLHLLQQRQMLPDYRLSGLNMGEDHLFGLLAKALGMELGNLSGQGLPFGCAWKGLPVSPEQLVQDEKKIIHSTRSWQQLNETQIREYFRNKRIPKQINCHERIG